MAKRILDVYRSLVKRRPTLTPICTAGIVTTTGDIIAQKLENGSESHNLRRTLVMSTFGFCYFGPLVTAWLRILKRLNMNVIYTVLCDQVCFAPFAVASFVYLHPLLSGKDVEEAKSIFKSSYFSVLSRGWLLWCPAQIFNFAFIPFEFRMLYMQFVSLIWNTFLSYRANNSLHID